MPGSFGSYDRCVARCEEVPEYTPVVASQVEAGPQTFEDWAPQARASLLLLAISGLEASCETSGDGGEGAPGTQSAMTMHRRSAP